MIKQNLIVISAIVIIVGIFLSPMLFNWLGFFIDDYYETFSRHYFNAQAVREGALPLWDPHTFGGGRINCIPNTNIWYWPLYPFYIFTSLRSADSAYTGLVKCSLLFHWLLCALTAYGLGVKAIRLRPLGAFVLAIVYTFGAGISYNIDPATIYATVWLPLVIWGIVSLAESRSWLMGVGGALAVSFTAASGSDVRGIFGLVSVGLCVGLLTLFASVQWSWKRGRRFLISGVIVFIIGLLLSGPYWTAMVNTLSIYRGSPLLLISRSASEMFSMPGRHLLTLFVPDLFGTLTNSQGVDLGIPDLSEYSYVEGNISGGFWLMLLWLVGSWQGWRKKAGSENETIRRQWWLIGLVLFVFSLLLVTGRYSPVYRWLSRTIPVFGLPYALRWRIMEHLGIAISVGVSAHWLRASRRPLPRLAIAGLLVVVLAVVAWQWTLPIASGGSGVFNYAWAHYRQWVISGPLLYLLVAVVGSIILLFFARKSAASVVLYLVVVMEVLAVGFSVVYFLSYGDDPAWVRHKLPSETEYYQWTNYAPLTNLPPARTGRERTTFYLSMLDQIATLHGGDYLLGHCSKPLAPRLLKVLQPLTTGYPYALRITDEDSRLFPNMSVRYLVLEGQHTLPGLSGAPRPLAGNQTLYLHRLRDTIPRVFTHNRVVLCSADEARQELMSRDLRKAAFMDKETMDIFVNQSPVIGHQSPPSPQALIDHGLLVTDYTLFIDDQDSMTADQFEKLQQYNYIHRVERPGPNRMTIDIDMKMPSLLITTDVWYPGWQVFVDGVKSTPFPVNYLQRGVLLDKGRHKVEWTFRPRTVKWGFLGMGLGLLAVIGLIIWTSRCPARAVSPDISSRQ